MQPCVPARIFNYSSLGRLTSAFKPENGTTSYRYDQNGNPLTKQETHGTTAIPVTITTTFGYDDLNRLAAKQYSDNTPAVTYCYDGDAGSHSVSRGSPPVSISWSCAGAPTTGLLKLHLTMASVSGGTVTHSTAFDALGRVLASDQVTGGLPPYIFPNYQYNLAGGLKSIQYPSGRTLTYGYDSAGRVSSVGGREE